MEIGDEALKELIPKECISVEDANHLAMSIEELWQHENLYLKYLAVISVEQLQTIEDALHFTVRLINLLSISVNRIARKGVVLLRC